MFERDTNYGECRDCSGSGRERDYERDTLSSRVCEECSGAGRALTDAGKALVSLLSDVYGLIPLKQAEADEQIEATARILQRRLR